MLAGAKPEALTGRQWLRSLRVGEWVGEILNCRATGRLMALTMLRLPAHHSVSVGSIVSKVFNPAYELHAETTAP